MKHPSKVTTRESRKNIGFPANRLDWSNSPAIYTNNTLSIYGHPVMEDWESPYMEKLASIACAKVGHVLEVGFGMGISSSFVQRHEINSHTVIEPNDSVFLKLLEFAQNAHKIVVPIQGFWEDVCPSLPCDYFTGILFDTYPLKEEEVHCNHFSFFKEAYRLLKPGGVFTYYSDEAKNFSRIHREQLKLAGFKSIKKSLCEVKPPKECLYWKRETLLIPIVTKENDNAKY